MNSVHSCAEVADGNTATQHDNETTQDKTLIEGQLEAPSQPLPIRLENSLASNDAKQERSNETAQFPHGDASVSKAAESCRGTPGRAAGWEFVECFKSLPNLSTLYLMGNPITKQIVQYRRTMIASEEQYYKAFKKCQPQKSLALAAGGSIVHWRGAHLFVACPDLPGLRFLDDRPVKQEDQDAAIAWFRGGEDEERDVLKAHREREQEIMRGHVSSLRLIQVRGHLALVCKGQSK